MNRFWNSAKNGQWISWLLLFAISVIVYLTASSFDWAENLIELSRHFEVFEADELVLALITWSVGALLLMLWQSRKIHRRNRELHTLARQLVDAQETERRRIASSLHDLIGQELVGISLKLNAALHSTDKPSGTIVEEVRSAVESLTSDVAHLSWELCPPVLYDDGLKAALEWLGNRYGTEGLNCTLALDNALSDVPQELAVIAYQAVRELLRNVIKHAHIDSAEVIGQRTESSIRISVADQGRGFDRKAAIYGRSVEGQGFGLSSMRIVITSFGGEFNMDSDLGRGTRITFSLPLPTSGAE